jgi:protein SCO1/2
VRAKLLLALVAFGISVAATAQPRPDLIKDVNLDQKLNTQIPLDLRFSDETGRSVALQEYFADKPVIMALVYYKCPMLCTQVLNGLVSALRIVKYDPGKDFEIVLVSIDPRETPEIAAKKKDSYIKSFNRPGTEMGWHFLTGQESNIKTLANAIGYRYRYDETTGQYAHPAGLIVLTPKGVTSQYFYGIEYSPRDVQFALVESGHNKVGTLVDKVILYCFAYDPITGKYGLVIMRVIRVFAVALVLVLGTYIVMMVRRERTSKAAPEDANEGAKQ